MNETSSETGYCCNVQCAFKSRYLAYEICTLSQHLEEPSCECVALRLEAFIVYRVSRWSNTPNFVHGMQSSCVGHASKSICIVVSKSLWFLTSHFLWKNCMCHATNRRLTAISREICNLELDVWWRSMCAGQESPFFVFKGQFFGRAHAWFLCTNAESSLFRNKFSTVSFAIWRLAQSTSRQKNFMLDTAINLNNSVP